MNASTNVPESTLTVAAAERAQAARALRDTVRRRDHAAWEPPAQRADPVAVLTAQDAARLTWLVPVRHARMAESALGFYRGAAAIMAAGLAGTPVTWTKRSRTRPTRRARTTGARWTPSPAMPR